MRNVILACAVAVTTLAGCSKRDAPPVVMTPEMEAEQERAHKKVNAQESARDKSESGDRSSHRQDVQDEERARQKR